MYKNFKVASYDSNSSSSMNESAVGDILVPIGVAMAIYGSLFIAALVASKAYMKQVATKTSVAINHGEFKEAIGILKDECVDWAKDSKFSKFIKSGAMMFNNHILINYSDYIGKMSKKEIKSSEPFWVYGEIAQININKYIEDLGLVQKFNINYNAAKNEMEKIINDISEYLLKKWAPIAEKNEILKKYMTPMVVLKNNTTLSICIASTQYLIFNESKYLD